MTLSTIHTTTPTFKVQDQPLKYQKNCVDYFAGIGLVRLGLRRAGWRVIFANDWATEKFDMYSAYFGNGVSHYEVKDIFDLSYENLPASLLATASFPCIDLSLAGNLKGIKKGKHSSAFWGFINALKHQSTQPPLVLSVSNQ